PAAVYDVVGPICESGDFIGLGRELVIGAGDLLAILSTGAYGMAMSSNYNTRPRAMEIVVKGDRAHVIRQREKTADLYALECLLPGLSPPGSPVGGLSVEGDKYCLSQSNVLKS
ncbi:MAG: hypothetical protein LBJ59_11135, partial [Zoogloeaceae bacterium]|nr:hypothetical protein [Zoogloeaceae bacterium]